jgi:putative YhdH/YhfP family quinone oxidoreductase
VETTFKALRIFQEDKKAVSKMVTETVDQLDPGDVVIKTAYASVNYKDALAITGKGRIIERFPCIAGIDMSGTVESSTDARFKPGDPVMLHGNGLGVSRDGGFSGRVRAMADMVVPVPPGLSLFEVSALGVAGYTTGIAIMLCELNGMLPSNGKVLVNGATGGCGSIAIDILSNKGYHVVALTGKDSSADYLKSLGAAEVISRNTLEMGKRPLEKSLWAAAFDSVGGEQLSWLTRSMQKDGVIASFGNAGGQEFTTSVFPFILRGVRLIGVNSDNPPEFQREVWRRLGTDLRPRSLSAIAHKISLDELPAHCERLIQGGYIGRGLVSFL